MWAMSLASWYINLADTGREFSSSRQSPQQRAIPVTLIIEIAPGNSPSFSLLISPTLSPFSSIFLEILSGTRDTSLRRRRRSLRLFSRFAPYNPSFSLNFLKLYSRSLFSRIYVSLSMYVYLFNYIFESQRALEQV